MPRDAPIIYGGLGSQMRVMSLEELAAEKNGSRRVHPMMEAMAVSGFDLMQEPENKHRRQIQPNAEMTPAQSTQIDNLIYTILELRKEGNKRITPLQALRAMFDRKLFSSASGLNFTELVALGVRRGFIKYVKADDALFVSVFEWDDDAVEGDTTYIPKIGKIGRPAK